MDKKQLIDELRQSVDDDMIVRELIQVAEFASGEYKDPYPQYKKIVDLADKFLPAIRANIFASSRAHRHNIFDGVEKFRAEMVAARDKVRRKRGRPTEILRFEVARQIGSILAEHDVPITGYDDTHHLRRSVFAEVVHAIFEFARWKLTNVRHYLEWIINDFEKTDQRSFQSKTARRPLAEPSIKTKSQSRRRRHVSPSDGDRRKSGGL
jgi:hypothetical protein